jgi:uncharacterized protein YgiM (DUF1202 family)
MTRRRMLTVFALFGATLLMLAACAEVGPPSPPFATGASPALPTYYANIAGLPLRKGPTTSDPEISTLQFNDEVHLLETKDGWGRVLDVSRNIEGWTAMHYLQPSPAQWPRQLLRQERPAPKRPALKPSGNPPQTSGAPVSKTAEMPPPAPIYYANIAGLPLRKGPTTSDREISTLQFNDEVQLLEIKDGWGRVLDVSRNIEGWAAMRYLQPNRAQWPRRFLR